MKTSEDKGRKEIRRKWKKREDEGREEKRKKREDERREMGSKEKRKERRGVSVVEGEEK